LYKCEKWDWRGEGGGVVGLGFSLMRGGNSKCGYRVSESLCKEGGVPYMVLGWWGVQPVDN